MKKNETWFLVLFSIFSVAVFAVAVSLKDRVAVERGSRLSDNMAGNGMLALAAPDDDMITNADGGYYFSAPVNWYVEKKGADLAVYPDYDPKSVTAPDCKIEASILAMASSSVSMDDADNLNFWITDYLHADPTADISEISRKPVAFGEGASTTAVEWFGVLNGVTTTLVYAAMPRTPSGSVSVLELAPSSLSSSSDADGDDCTLALQALTANIKFGNYEP